MTHVPLSMAAFVAAKTISTEFIPLFLIPANGTVTLPTTRVQVTK